MKIIGVILARYQSGRFPSKLLEIKGIMTSDIHKLSTDRIGKVAYKIPSDLIVNIQGDEPLL